MTLDRILEAAKASAKGDRDTINRIEDIQWSHDYAVGQGYSLDGKKGIVFSNWNNVQHRVPEPKYWEDTNDVMKRLFDILERAGYECEWSDEWTTCNDCGKALRTSYDWQPAYHCDDNGILCNECLDPETVLESLEDNPKTANNNPHIDPAEYGYELIEDKFESGFHLGQTDDPKKIFARLQEKGYSRILFNIDRVQQFDTRFSVYRKVTEDNE
jgi:hypothetical protein